MAIGLVTMGAASTCHRREPALEPPASTGEAAAPRSSGDRDVDRLPVDEIGRLLTAPGLCSILERRASPHPKGHELYLALSYDDRGRPEQAEIEIGPYCRGSELAGDEPTLVGEVDPCDPPDLQRELVAWRWDAHDRLVAVEHTATLERGAAEGKRRCLGSDPFVVERSQWSYDEDGRLTKWTRVSADCDGREAIEETLRHGDSEGAVTRVVDGDRTESHYRLDRRGTVIEEGPLRHQYDSIGRLVETRYTDGRIQRWSYDAPLVGSDVPWTQEFSDDERTLILRGSGRASEDRIEIALDERRRPIEIKADEWSWELEYGGCKRAESARAQWIISEFVWMWPFPAPTRISWGDEAREAWIRGDLLRSPFAY